MYWFNLRKITILGAACILTSGLPACRPDVKQTGASSKFFDLQKYFATEAARLSKLNPEVNKTVMHNGSAESHRVKINNWKRELDLFASSAINKPSWKDSYKVDSNANTVVYKTLDPDLKTQEILIKRVDGKVKYIQVYNSTHNLLYQTKEKLTYVPDSLYQIERTQKVRLLSGNQYQIKGVITGDR